MEVMSEAPNNPVKGARTERFAPVVIRGAWLALIVSGVLVGAAVSGRSTPIVVVSSVLWWGAWGLGLVAVLVWHPAGLVLLRCAAPASWVATIWAANHSAGQPLWLRILGVSAASVGIVVMASSETGHLCVNGPAYPNERRFLLRPAAALTVGPLYLSGALVAGGVIIGPLLLAARQWLLGALTAVAGAVFICVLGKALYGQTRRFVVFVPAGFVLHDEFVLRDPALFLRRTIEQIRPAPADTDSLDLTNNASGLAIEVLLTEKSEIVRITSRSTSETGKTARFLFVPTLPGRLLNEARSRRIVVERSV